MGINYNTPQIVTDGLIFCLDAGNKKSLDFNSLYFDGNGDYVQFADSELFNFGSGDFTVETWIFLNSLPSSGFYWSILSQRTNYSNNYAFTFAISPDSGGSVYFSMSQNGNASQSDIVAGLIPIAAGVWAHVAVSRQSGTTKMFMNGNLVTTNTATNVTIFNSSATVKCGAFDEPAWSNSFLNGHIKDLRVTKGVARYTNNFTPIQRIEHSIDPYKANVSLLLNPGTSSVTKDYSDNNLTPTVFGNTSISSPWLDLSQNRNNAILLSGPTYNSSNLGSVVFDGSDDKVDILNNFTNTTVTVECLIWLNTNQKNKTFITNYTEVSSAPTGFGLGISDSTNNVVKWFTGNLGTTNTLFSTTILANQTYYHIVATYDGTTKKLYINGNLEAFVQISNNINNTSTLASVGYARSINSQFFNGRIPAVKVYNRAITESEIKQNFNALRGRYGI